MASWYTSLTQIESLGSTSKRPGSLAGLHEARKVNLAQFFTPADLVSYLWRALLPSMESALQKRGHGLLSLFDNAVGSGRLFMCANPNEYSLSGLDIHAPSIEALAKTAEEAGFITDFHVAGMESVSASGFDVAIINPPFSIRLESPHLLPYSCTTWGKYGPNTAAVSHEYALHQALDACSVVAAILPATHAAQVCADPELIERLVHVFDLPRGTFKEESTDVATSLLIFDSVPTQGKPGKTVVASLADQPPVLHLTFGSGSKGRIRVAGIEDSEPTITLPVTGSDAVTLSHNGRHLKLGFACGLMQAKVMNQLLGSRLSDHHDAQARHRYNRGLLYTGQGLLDLEVHLAQDDPEASFEGLVDAIARTGARVEVAPGVRQYLNKRIRQVAREKTPFRHTIYVPGGKAGNVGSVTGKARKTHLLNPKVWGSPVIHAGTQLTFTVQDEDGRYVAEVAGQPYFLSADELYALFKIQDGADDEGWRVLHEGLSHAFPEQAALFRARARRMGIDQWLWQYQLDDLIELSQAPRGAVVAWEMGLGKARLASAMILINEVKHGLVVVEAGLVPEMVVELKGLPIDKNDWQVIDGPDKLTDLRRINIISYERLRRAVSDKSARITYAHALRRRTGMVIADEGHLLANPNSARSRALVQLSAKRRFVLTGSPIANYPRDIHPLIAFACGDGTAAQPYGYHRAYMDERYANSMLYAPRGIDQFREDFVTLEWVTNEFAEDNRSGAKREIPRIANLSAYRRFVSAHVKRRVAKEPEVAPYVNIPDPTIETVTVEWETPHLAYYLKVADEFTNWYTTARRNQGSKNLNLIAILARIQAVTFASNFPQHGVEGVGAYGPMTSKQKKALDMLGSLTQNGHKTILYAKNPALLEMLHRKLNEKGLRSTVYHGEIPITRRTRALNEEFRFGDTPILLASVGVTQAGLNLYQADRVIFFDRDWAWKTEYQAMRRVLRPQQKRDVVVYYLHLAGGIDDYQGQMVDHKRDAMNAGLDWATPELDDVAFLHLDTLLGEFVNNLAELHGMCTNDFRAAIKACA